MYHIVCIPCYVLCIIYDVLCILYSVPINATIVMHDQFCIIVTIITSIIIIISARSGENQ